MDIFLRARARAPPHTPDLLKDAGVNTAASRGDFTEAQSVRSWISLSFVQGSKRGGVCICLVPVILPFFSTLWISHEWEFCFFFFFVLKSPSVKRFQNESAKRGMQGVRFRRVNGIYFVQHGKKNLKQNNLITTVGTSSNRKQPFISAQIQCNHQLCVSASTFESACKESKSVQTIVKL